MENHDSNECISVAIKMQNSHCADLDNKNSNTKFQSFNCAECSLNFTTPAKFDSHNKKVHKQIKIQCPVCHTMFRRRDHLRRHMRTVHCLDRVACPICDQDCTDLDSLRQHIRDFHPDESQYHCAECLYTPTDLEDLVSHKKMHLSNNKFVCELCNARFKRQDHLNRHVKSIHLQDFVKCDICEQKFKRRDHLRRHTREQHTTVFSEKIKITE